MKTLNNYINNSLDMMYTDAKDFVDYVTVYLITGKYDPTDISSPYESEDEYKQNHIKHIKLRYSHIIELPLETLYNMMIKHKAYIFMPEKVFNFKEGKFTDQFESILTNDLKMNKLN